MSEVWRCENCKFWKVHTDGAYIFVERAGGGTDIERGWGYCQHPKPLWRTHSYDEEGLDTHPEFGCAQFEPEVEALK